MSAILPPEPRLQTTATRTDVLRAETGENRVEVEDGEIVISEQNMGFLHVIVIQHLFRLLDVFVSTNNLGTVYIDGARYILAGTTKHIQRAYIPDLSFLRAGRIPPDFRWEGDFVGVPDLAVEVVSPGQSNSALLLKIGRYLQAGSEEAWLIYPRRQSIYQYRQDADEPNIYRGADVIDTSRLFSGLSIVAQDLFVTGR